jgi:Holliday junction DNA helicase RuvA
MPNVIISANNIHLIKPNYLLLGVFRKTMIAYLSGKFTYKAPTVVYVDVQGIGYEVNISLNTFTQIQQMEEGRLYTYLQIKEDAHTLYGFFDIAEKEMFLLLISVSGVGAATARMMLSGMKPAEISNAILMKHTSVLESVKGIGRKTAERLVLELKDKVSKTSISPAGNVTVGNTFQQDALNALIALGISRPVAEQAIKKIIMIEPSINSLETLIKKALKAI